jgi:hypothetical protein
MALGYSFTSPPPAKEDPRCFKPSGKVGQFGDTSIAMRLSTGEGATHAGRRPRLIPGWHVRRSPRSQSS